MKKRVKKLIKQDWKERTFDKKRSPKVDFLYSWVKYYYKNNEQEEGS